MGISKISTKFFRIIIYISLFTLAISSFFAFKVMDDIENDALEMVSKNLSVKIQNKIDSSLQLGITNAIAISQNSQIIKALKSNDKQKAYEVLKALSQEYSKFTSYKKGKIHIHTADVRSFLRSWDPEHAGDELGSFRETINTVKRTQKPVLGIEIGWADLVIRAIVPIMDGDKYLGSLEFIQDFDQISTNLKNEKKYFFPLIDTKLLKNQFDKDFIIDRYAMVEKNYNREFFFTLKQVDFNKLVKKGYISRDNKYFTILPIIGFNDTFMGYYVLGMDNEAFAKIIFNSKEIAYIFIALMVFMTFVIVVVMNLTIKKLIVSNLTKVSEGLSSFFDFLNQKSDSVDKIDIISKDEIGQMAQEINSNIAYIKNLTDSRKKEIWKKDGLSGLAKELSRKSDLADLCSSATGFVCEYVNAGVGTLYVFDEEKNELDLYGSYAFVQRNELSNKFKPGEATVGQVALQKTPIQLKNITRDMLLIDTGTTSEPPLNTYTFPLIYREKLYGVMEVGSTVIFDNTQKGFFNDCAEYIATALFSAIQNLKVKRLLGESEKANTKLQEQKKITEQSNIELQHQQAQLEEANAQMQEQQAQLEEANSQLQEQQAQLEEANAQMEEQQVQLKESQKELEKQNKQLLRSREELNKKAKDLESSNRYKSEFLANMSHELRTPLNSIILLSSMLKENKKQNLSEDDIKKANIINSSGEELLRLINDVLDLSKVEAGRMEMLVEKFDSKSFLSGLKDMFEPAAQNKSLEFIVEDNYNDIISTDKDKLSQVIRNFLSNSLKFTHKGFIKLFMEKHGDNNLKVSVQDSGIGIPKEKQEMVFQAFAQVDGSTSRQYGGTGLGLSITKEMVKLMEGEIFLESKEGEGSTFSIVIPNINSKEDIMEQKEKSKNIFEAEKEEPLIKTEEKDDSCLDEVRVDDDSLKITQKDKPFLVIEDSLDFAETLKSVINDNGDLAYIAVTGQKGIDIAHENSNIQGILLDLGLPDMDGLDVLKHLKSDIKTKKIPVYIISGRDNFDKAKFSDAVGFKQKPLSNEDFKNVFEDFKKFYDKNPLEDVNRFLKNVKSAPKAKPMSVNEINLGGKKILVVDDDMRNTFVLVEILEDKGAKVLTASNGKEALDMLDSNKDINLVLMDIMMPEMDGFEAIEKIRADKELENIPVIAVTAKAMNQDKERCFEAGANDFLTKPLNLDTFLGVVQAWIK